MGSDEPQSVHGAGSSAARDSKVDEVSRTIGFREAQFTDHGFELNGKVIKLRGLDRHQTFPWVGQAMPGRAQRRDAQILRNKLKCNIVRTSHYPQSRHFLDACDEIGLLVLEEIPGWQHIGDEAWKLISIDNVSRMIRRDWNHPSIILWGVRINESKDDHDFYVRTNAMAHKLDPTRQTGGIRYFQESEFLEDVFTMNDFGFPLKPPNHPRYLNTEFVGHTYPTKTIDQVERLTEHTVRHARIHDQLASIRNTPAAWAGAPSTTTRTATLAPAIASAITASPIFSRTQAGCRLLQVAMRPGGRGCAGASIPLGARRCVSRILKGGGVLQLRPREALHRRRTGCGSGPDRKQFQHLRYAPFVIELAELFHKWGDLRLEGYIQGKQVIVKKYSGKGMDQKFTLLPDDTSLIADGADTTRVVLRVTDEFDAIRPFANDAIKFELEGPAELIGDNPFALVGGTGAIWIRAKEQAGTVRLTATHPVLGKQQVQFEIGGRLLQSPSS